MRKGNQTLNSFTVEDDLISESSFAMSTRMSQFQAFTQPRISQKRQQEIQQRARQEYYRQQNDNLIDPFKHRLAAGFAGSEEEIYQREKQKLERQQKKKEEERMNGSMSYTIVFHDKKGQAVVQHPETSVFKTCAKGMLDEQPQGEPEKKVVRRQSRQAPQPIQPIVESEGQDNDPIEEIQKWRPKSNNYINAEMKKKQETSVSMPSQQRQFEKPKPPVPKPQPKPQQKVTQKPSQKATQKGKNDDPKNKKYSQVYEGPDRGLVEQLERQLVECPNISFDDIADLETAKNLLQQAVLLPRLMPQFFQGIRRATKGAMLFGPPGTGKTLLAKAVAKGNIFFNVSASSLASKWKGESQKLVRILFEMAKFHAPSIIFFDEIDAIGSRRSSDENEANRKVKSELLVQMDGASGNSQQHVFVLAATNRPWDIDEALRRRLEKRIYIPLPTAEGRRRMFEINLNSLKVEQKIDWNKLVKMTKDYSGADIANVCREAAYMPMRRKLAKIGGLGNLSEVKELEKQIDVALTENDFIEAIKNVSKSVGGGDLKKYEEWMKEFGSS